MLNVAVIGAGRIGKLHAENLVLRIPETNVVTITDVNLPAAQETAARLNIPNVSADYREALKDGIDAVIICSSTDTHTQFIIEAAAAGKHIFCEKPIDLSLKRIDEALAAVDKAGVKLQIGFNRRFDPNFRRVRDAVECGEIGQPHRLHIISRDPAPPPISYVRVSGGMFVDMTIHDFDMARFLVGAEVDEIYTVAGVLVDPAIGAEGDVDSALIVLKFANGVIGSIENSRQAVYGYDQRVEVFGSGGSISTDNNYPNSATISTAQNVRRDLPLNFFVERYTESYVNEIRAFVDAVVNDKPVPVTGYDGRVPVVMARAARKSYDENRPVKLSEIGAE
ncbi:MAG TPA: inositol 2-dehydrogenase [Oceanobacillus sp.]|nr:inositol 2-dehydrogenase [Oceanobacillus sp.]